MDKEKSKLIKELNDAANYLKGAGESLNWFKEEFPEKISKLVHSTSDESDKKVLRDYSVMVSAAYFLVESTLKDLKGLFPYGYNKSNGD